MFYKIVFSYVGAVIGAGFASGQEILQFFIAFDDDAYPAVILATLLFCYCGAVLIYYSIKNRTTSYDELLALFWPGVLARIIDTFSALMLWGGVIVMLAGSGALFHEQLHCPEILGRLLLGAAILLFLWGGLKGFLLANAYLVPVKLTVIYVICFLVLMSNDNNAMGGNYEGYKSTAWWWWSAVLYVSYNLIMPLAVFPTLGRLADKRTGVAGAVVGGLLLGLTATLIIAACTPFKEVLVQYDLPLLYIARTKKMSIDWLFSLLLWLAILTTAIADTHGLASRWAKNNCHRYKWASFTIVATAVPFAAVDFNRLVNIMYPMFGYFSIILIITLLIYPWLNLIRKVK